jgi:TP901 family phage tail tape measure protein
VSDRLDTAFVEIEPDFSTFNRNVESGVRDASRTIERNLTSSLDIVEDNFSQFGSVIVDDLDDAFDDIADSADDAVDDILREFGNVEEEIRGFSRIDDLEQMFNDAAAEAVRSSSTIEEELADIREEARRTGSETEEALSSGTEEASGGFRSIADSAVGAGVDIRGAMTSAAGAAGIGAIIAAAIAAVDAFIDMGQEALELEGDLIRAASTVDTGFSTANVEAFREGLQDLQSEYGILTDQTVPALDAALAQGVPEDNVIAFLETAAQSAIVTGEDLEGTVTVINGLMAQFGDEFGTAAEAADFLTVTLGNTTADVADVGDVLGEISGFARDAGVGATELSAALAAMSITGRDAGTSGGQLAAFIEELGDATTPVAEAFNELTGQSFQDFIAQGGTVQEAAQVIADGAADAGQSVVELAGSAETSSAILALTTEEGAARFNDALAETQDAVGTTSETFGELEDSGALAFSQLEGSMATLRDEAGAAIAPIVAELVDGLIPVLEELSPILSAVGEIFVSALGVALEFLAPIIDFVLQLFESLSPILELLQPFFDILSLIGEIVGTILAPVFEVLFAILTPIFELIAVLLTPVLEFLGWLFQQLADVIAEYVAPWLISLAESISNNLGPIIDWLSERIAVAQFAFKLLVDWVVNNWDRITGAIQSGVDKVTGFFDTMASVAKGAINTIIDAWNSIDFSFSVSIPDWVPSIGGSSFSISDVVPDIPRLQTGGFTTDEGLALLHPDEMVLPLSNQNGIGALADAMRQAGAGGEGGDVYVTVKIGEQELHGMVDTRIQRNTRTQTRRARAGTGRN